MTVAVKEEGEICRAVALGFQSFLRDFCSNIWMNVGVPKTGGKMAANCTVVYKWCEKNKVGIEFYFRMVNGSYDSSWIKQAFNRKYIPFALATSDTGFKRVLNLYKPIAKDDQFEQVKQWRTIVNSYSPGLRKNMIETLDCIPESLKRELLTEINL